MLNDNTNCGSRALKFVSLEILHLQEIRETGLKGIEKLS